MGGENQNEVAPAQQLDIKLIIERVITYILQYYWLVLLFMAVGASMLWYDAKKSYVPYYQSYATCTISNSYDSGSDSNYLLKAKTLATMFPYLTNTTTFNKMLTRELGTESINGVLNASVSENSNLLTISVTSVNSKDAHDILLAAIKCYPDIADYVVGTVYLHIITPASVSDTPINSPDYNTPAVKGMLMGAGVLIAFFLLLAVVNNKISDSRDIERMLNAKCIAVIPAVSFKRRKKNTDIPVTILNSKVGYAFKEAYRNARTRIRRYADKNKCQVIIVTSAVPGEGKTTTSVNTALSLAGVEKRVVLIDADLRKPSVANTLKLDEAHFSISNVLKGQADVMEALVDVKGSNLKVLAGSNIKNALECMGSEEMKNIIEELRENFDYIIIDTPPCGVMSDASLISSYADGVIMVVRYNKSRINYVRHALSSLTVNGIPLIGCVLNYKREELSDIAASYRYGASRYGYGYGRYSKYSRYGGYGYRSTKNSDADDLEDDEN